MTPPLVLLHGFLGSPEDWAGVVRALGARRACRAVPLPGHPTDDAEAGEPPASFEDAVARLARGLEDAAPFDVLGYSMGGRVALRMLCARPELIRRAAIVGASPGIEDASERRRRARHDASVAERLERGPAERFVDSWYAQPIFASLRARTAFDAIRARRAAACATHAAGMARALRILGVGGQEPLWKPLVTCPVPALLMAGSLDAKYAESNRRLAGSNPQFEAVTVPGAGHAPHLEQPDEFLRIVRDWLERP